MVISAGVVLTVVAVIVGVTLTVQRASRPTQTVLPFTGLNNPWGVAVDTAGSVYVTDGNNNRVVKLAAG